MLGVGAGNLRFPHGVAVDEKPAPANDVRIGGGRFRFRRTEPVAGSRQQIGRHGIDGDIRPGIGAEFFQRFRRGRNVVVIEISRLGMRFQISRRDGFQDADFEDIPPAETTSFKARTISSLSIISPPPRGTESAPSRRPD